MLSPCTRVIDSVEDGRLKYLLMCWIEGLSVHRQPTSILARLAGVDRAFCFHFRGGLEEGARLWESLLGAESLSDVLEPY